jgi:hypothetical protein
MDGHDGSLDHGAAYLDEFERATNKCYECIDDCDCGVGQYCVLPNAGVDANGITNEKLYKQRGTCQNKNTAVFGKPCHSYTTSATLFPARTDSDHPSDGFCGEIREFVNASDVFAAGQPVKSAGSSSTLDAADANWVGVCVNHVCRECREGEGWTTSTSAAGSCGGTRMCVDGRWVEKSGAAPLAGEKVNKPEKLKVETDQELAAAMRDNTLVNKDISGAILAFLLVLVCTSVISLFLMMKITRSTTQSVHPAPTSGGYNNNVQVRPKADAV